MDTYRGFSTGGSDGDDAADYGAYEESIDEQGPASAPPPPIGQDERRMQVRAYNFWASLLDQGQFPPVQSLLEGQYPDFADHSVLLHFDNGIEDPAIPYLGDVLAQECEAGDTLRRLSDVPGRSLLSRITDHYLQIIANQAPIGFEAEFVNQRGRTILYRGILLPFSTDNTTIDYIYGVINWKELADQQTTDALLLEIDQALDQSGGSALRRVAAEPLGAWADGPDSEAMGAYGADMVPLDLADFGAPIIGSQALGADEFTLDLPEADGDFGLAEEAPSCLADWLASARDLAHIAHSNEDRTRSALYAAIGRAWDFALAAQDAPEDFAEMVADAGLTMQQRAPLTPLVKLVFGADYDKTRITEYAAALSHAQRIGLGFGELGGFLAKAPGGLKGVVALERKLRRADSGKAPQSLLVDDLRALSYQPLHALAPEGPEFALVLVRRLESGAAMLVGEIAGDQPLLERAARRLLG